jgi:hypothetical protein
LLRYYSKLHGSLSAGQETSLKQNIEEPWNQDKAEKANVPVALQDTTAMLAIYNGIALLLSMGLESVQTLKNRFRLASINSCWQLSTTALRTLNINRSKNEN